MKHSHGSQRQTLHDWSGLVRCWGQTHSTDVHWWGWTSKRTRDNIEKVWEAILQQNGVCLSCPTEIASNSSTDIHVCVCMPTCARLHTNSTIVQTLSEPSNTCWVQSLQRMPQPHTKLLLWWSWSQHYKNTTLTSFSSYWLYNGIKVAI